MAGMEQPVDSLSFCESVLFTLGVILLEPVDGKRLEGTSFWMNTSGQSEIKRLSAIKWWENPQQRQPECPSEPIWRCLREAFGSYP
jgi:hypothetical protein